MPRLPSLDDLGRSPVPVSNRQIASNEQAGAVGQALQGFGRTAQGIGQGMLEKQDKLEYASARTAALASNVRWREEVRQDPNYEGWESTYLTNVRADRDKAAALIRNQSDRRVFIAETDADIARGAADVRQGALGRGASVAVEQVKTLSFSLSDTAQGALDAATREATITTMSQAIKGLEDKGYITPVEAGDWRRTFAQSYTVKQINALVDREDLEGASALFESSRGRLDDSTEIQLSRLLSGARQNRENLVVAERVVYGGQTQPSGAPAKAPGPWQSVAVNVAREFRLDPTDVAAVMSYESAGTFSSTIMGGKGGKYMGLIQFGPAERKKYGITVNSSPEDWTKAISSFLHDRGFKPGMGVLDLYSTINAGRPGRYKASDGNGTVTSHVGKILREHRDKAEQWLDGAGTQAPVRHDLNNIYAEIDEIGRDWSPERREAVKAQAARLVARDESLLDRQQEDAFNSVLAKADALGRSFTDVSQLGATFYQLPPARQMQIKDMAAENAKPVEPPANGEAIRKLKVLASGPPADAAKLVSINLAQYRPYMTAAEYEEISVAQSRARAELQKPSSEWAPRTGITAAISWGEKFGGVDLSKDDSARFRVYRFMEARANEMASNGKRPTEADYQAFFQDAVREVHVQRSFLGVDILAPDTTRRGHEVLSPNYKALIRRHFKAAFGRDPSDAEMQDWFEKMGQPLQ